MKIFLKHKLKDFTTFKIGGICDVIVEPKDVNELGKLIKFLRENNYIFYILGNGSNLLVSDKGVHGCVIHLGNNFSKIKVNGTKIEAEAGALMSEIANVALKHNLTGFEELSGIPGSIGGALTMNAGAYDKEMANIVTFANAINEEGKIIKLSKELLDFGYRKSSIPEKKYIVTTVAINLQEGKKNEIKEKMEKYRNLRLVKQPLEYPSAGSVFKRPETGFASLLIQDSNLKGETIGGAMVSEKHAGFIINSENATASDVYRLMVKVQQTVKTYFNIELEPEIKLWGKFN